MSTPNQYDQLASTSEFNKLEVVTTCVGFSDILDYTLASNHSHADNYIIVTSHDDKDTQHVAEKHSAICVKTDLFKKNGRKFNKGAAINLGFGHFQYNGWRLHLDSDIILPDNFRRMLFNHTHLDPQCLYGADRQDMIGTKEFDEWHHAKLKLPQHAYQSGLSSIHGGKVYAKIPSASSSRFVGSLYGYCPIGFFQLWHASQQRPYPYSLGTAAHDDLLFAASFPEEHRRLLPSVICYHLNSEPSCYGRNWEGRQSPVFK